MTWRWTSAATVAAGLLLAPAVMAQQATDDGVALREDFVSAFNAGDHAALAELYAADALILPPNADQVRGSENIADYWRQALEEGRLSDLDLTHVETQQAGGTVFEIGSYTMTGPGPDGRMGDVTGDYVVILTSGPEGRMELARHIWNIKMPLGAQTAVPPGETGEAGSAAD